MHWEMGILLKKNTQGAQPQDNQYLEQSRIKACHFKKAMQAQTRLTKRARDSTILLYTFLSIPLVACLLDRARIKVICSQQDSVMVVIVHKTPIAHPAFVPFDAMQPQKHQHRPGLQYGQIQTSFLCHCRLTSAAAAAASGSTASGLECAATRSKARTTARTSTTKATAASAATTEATAVAIVH